MTKLVLKYGLIAGAVLAVLTGVVVPLTMDKIHGAVGMVIGFSGMILAFLTIFFAIRSDREQNGGAITFGRALRIGLLITLIGSAFYVAGWQVAYYNFVPDFEEEYAAATMAKLRAQNKSPEELAKAQKEMDEFVVSYRKPLVNIGFTFLEVVPVGVILSFVAAGILRRRRDEPAGAAAIA